MIHQTDSAALTTKSLKHATREIGGDTCQLMCMILCACVCLYFGDPRACTAFVPQRDLEENLVLVENNEVHI